MNVSILYQSRLSFWRVNIGPSVEYGIGIHPLSIEAIVLAFSWVTDSNKSQRIHPLSIEAIVLASNYLFQRCDGLVSILYQSRLSFWPKQERFTAKSVNVSILYQSRLSFWH